MQNLNTQYHPQPTALNIEAAIKFAAERNKLLLVYVHHVETTDSFLTNVLCSREVCNFITENYIFWGCFGQTEEGSEIVARFSEEQAIFFAVINTNTTEIMGRMLRLPKKDQLMTFLFSFVAPRPGNIDYQAIEDRLIREQQEKELKEAEVLERLRLESERLKKEKKK